MTPKSRTFFLRLYISMHFAPAFFTLSFFFSEEKFSKHPSEKLLSRQNRSNNGIRPYSSTFQQATTKDTSNAKQNGGNYHAAIRLYINLAPLKKNSSQGISFFKLPKRLHNYFDIYSRCSLCIKAGKEFGVCKVLFYFFFLFHTPLLFRSCRNVLFQWRPWEIEKWKRSCVF